MIDLDPAWAFLKAKEKDEGELKRKSCCCGGTKSIPCVCMLKGIMKCSMNEPKCPCYALLDKQKKKAKEVSKMVGVF
tara:strand:- start:457 stop:687 length:231 start_codon:yes stop_codon:yes gene_type:complete